MKVAFLIAILIIGFALRLYRIEAPIADWHSWRQADTAAVTRNFIKEGFNPFYPKYDDMSGVSEHPYPNLGRFRFVEFPVFNILTYPFYLFFGVDERYHRLVSIFLSLGSAIFLYLISKKYTNLFVAFLSTLTFLLLPFNIFFSRVILPESALVFFSLGMIYFVDQWISQGKKVNLLLGFLFTTIAFLIKPYAFFFALPLIYSIISKERKIWGIFKPKYLLFFALAIAPFILWRFWILQHPEGIPASNWLLNGDGIRFRPAFWKWLISERIGGEILGVSGTFLYLLGIITRLKSGSYFLHLWALSMFLYMIIFATGNVRHNYYQIILVPILSIFFSIGLNFLITSRQDFIPRIWRILLAILFFILTFYFTWDKVKGFYQVNNYPIVEAGKKADQILPKEARVVTPYQGDTAFLYQVNRSGFPVSILPLKEMVLYFGVTHYISTSNDAKTAWVKRYFEVLVDNPNYVIADLTKLKKSFDPTDREP